MTFLWLFPASVRFQINFWLRYYFTVMYITMYCERSRKNMHVANIGKLNLQNLWDTTFMWHKRSGMQYIYMYLCKFA